MVRFYAFRIDDQYMIRLLTVGILRQLLFLVNSKGPCHVREDIKALSKDELCINNSSRNRGTNQ